MTGWALLGLRDRQEASSAVRRRNVAIAMEHGRPYVEMECRDSREAWLDEVKGGVGLEVEWTHHMGADVVRVDHFAGGRMR
jgi:hypothetical protein